MELAIVREMSISESSKLLLFIATTSNIFNFRRLFSIWSVSCSTQPIKNKQAWITQNDSVYKHKSASQVPPLEALPFHMQAFLLFSFQKYENIISVPVQVPVSSLKGSKKSKLENISAEALPLYFKNNAKFFTKVKLNHIPPLLRWVSFFGHLIN